MKKLIALVVAITLLSFSIYAGTVRVYSNGTRDVVVPYSKQISVFAPGTTKVYQKKGYPNVPSSWSLLQTVSGTQYTSSAFTTNTSIRIAADVQGAWYSVDTTADVITPSSNLPVTFRKVPISKDATTDTAITVPQLLNGIIIRGAAATGGTVTYTLPLGAAMDASSDSFSIATGGSIEWTFINNADATADISTIQAATGHTIVGSTNIQSKDSTTGGLYGSSATFITRKTGSGTYVTYRK